MKKNWIRVLGTLAAFAGVCALVVALSSIPKEEAVVAVKPGTQVAHLLRSDYKHPAPPPPVVEEPAPVEEVYVEPPYSNAGSAVPFVPSDDPNNASGGDYLDPGGFCTSGSASGYPPVCD